MGDPTPYGLRKKGIVALDRSTPTLGVPVDLSRTTDFEEAPGIEIAVWSFRLTKRAAALHFEWPVFRNPAATADSPQSAATPQATADGWLVGPPIV